MSETLRASIPMNKNPSRDDSALVEALQSMVRYFMRKTSRDVDHFGVSERHFTSQALAKSFASPMNVDLIDEPSLAGLVAVARRGPSIFHFLWEVGATKPYVAATECFFTRLSVLKVRLLWLKLPDLIPVSPRMGPKNGYQPLKEAVFAVLLVSEDGHLEAPEPPR